MSAELRVRAAAEADVRSIASALSTAERQGWTHRQVRDELASRRSVVLVAERDGAVLGHAVAWRVAGELQILDVYVAPAGRRQGVGRALVLGLLDAGGGGEALLEVHQENVAALALYRSLGFEEVGRRPRYYADGGAALLLTRPA